MNNVSRQERSPASETRSKVAVVQAASVESNLERTLQKAEALASDAASQGARLWYSQRRFSLRIREDSRSAPSWVHARRRAARIRRYGKAAWMFRVPRCAPFQHRTSQRDSPGHGCCGTRWWNAVLFGAVLRGRWHVIGQTSQGHADSLGAAIWGFGMGPPCQCSIHPLAGWARSSAGRITCRSCAPPCTPRAFKIYSLSGRRPRLVAGYRPPYCRRGTLFRAVLQPVQSTSRFSGRVHVQLQQ